MEVISTGESNNQEKNNQDTNQYDNQKDNNEDNSSESILNNEIFSKKKNLFRVQIRNKKTRTLLQQKRNKIHQNDGEVLPSFYSDIIEDTFQEFIKPNPDLQLVQLNMKIIRREIEANTVQTLEMIKPSNLFMKLVQMITWGRNQPYLMFEIAFFIVLNVFAHFDCGDIVLEVAKLLIMSDEDGNLIDDRVNNALLQNQQTTQQYKLSVIENILENDEDILIREYATLLLSNISAENNIQVLRSIVSKGKIFKILQENIELNNFTDDMLECIVNILSNLSHKDFLYSDFCDTPELFKVLFPLVINKDIVNTTLISSFKRIVSLADDDEIHQIINYQFEIVSNLNNFIQQCDINNKYSAECCELILEVFQIFCSQFDSLTQQLVEIGILDSITHLLNITNSANEIIELSLKALMAIFSRSNQKINDHFLQDTNINKNQYLTRKIIKYASYCQSEIRNAALKCISYLIDGSSQEQCELIFDEKLMQTFLDSLSSDCVKKDTVADIINAICHLVFLGNLTNTPEQNPYTIIFLKLQGDCILDQIQDNLSENAYHNSQRLMGLILNENENNQNY